MIRVNWGEYEFFGYEPFRCYHIAGLYGDKAELGGGGAVEGTEEERRSWSEAAHEYQSTVLAAHRRLEKVRSRWRRLPGGRRRAERAERLFRERATAATEEYQPVGEEIKRRLAVHKAEWERQEKDRWQAERRCEARFERYRAAGQQAVWGCIVGQDAPAIVRVYRHDVPAGRALAAAWKQSL